MKSLLPIALISAAAALPLQGALACPPPPPGYVPPTAEQLLERSLQNVGDIVYGVVTKAGAPGEASSSFKIIHVYRGDLRAGQTVQAVPGWGHPEPVCVGMMSPAYPQPVGTYGVVAFAKGQRTLNFISPENVQIMIDKGWIKSARAR